MSYKLVDDERMQENVDLTKAYVSENAYLKDDTTETALADNDYIPFYDTSASSKKKSLWSNIKSVLKTYFDGLYSAKATSKGSATKGVYFDANGAVQEMTYTVGKSVPSDAVFTDTNTKVTQTNTTGSADYRVLLSENANDTTQTAGARKSANLKFNPSTGNLQTKQINGIAVGTTVSVTHTLSASANTNFDYTNIGADAVITEILATDGRGYVSREYINSGTGIRFVFAPDSSTPTVTMQIRYR